jgi:hypothetical protein
VIQTVRSVRIALALAISTAPVDSRPNDVSPNVRRSLLRQEAVDAGGRPRCDATAEEVRVLSPDRTAESKGGCENRPVVRITCVKPLPRFGFEIALEVQTDQSPERGYGS